MHLTDGMPDLPQGYLLEEVLGHRGSVWVLKARHGTDLVALRLEADGSTQESLAELAVLSAVDHPGVAPLLDHGPLASGGRYLARRWMAGSDLLSWSKGKEPEEIGSMLARLCPALDHLHRAGFVHADLKPENVIVTPEGRPILCDFGLSSRRGTIQPEDGVSGTLFAIAPEVLMGMELTPLSDLFALGAMLHRLLVGIKRTAREFYAIFPDRSYLDAAGSDPEDLPAWSRDLIVSLTARDPNRRPRSASAVGRLLAERLGVALDTRELVEELRWPAAFGRDGWIASWMETVDQDGQCLWVRVPEGENARPFWEHLRLFASLRGKTLKGLDLAAEMSGVEHGVALDEWSARVVLGGADWIAVVTTGLDVWKKRALESLECAARIEREKRGSGVPRLFVVSDQPQPSNAFRTSEVPAVTEGAIARFLERPLATEDPVRRNAFAARLAAATRGSASRLDRMLRSAQTNGWIFAQDEGFRLRPGELPDPVVLAGDDADVNEISALTRPELEVLNALQVTGGRASSEDLAQLSGLDARAFGAASLRLRRGGWIGRPDGSGETRLLRAISRPVQGVDPLRKGHDRRARALEGRAGASPRDLARAALHRFCSLPLESKSQAFVDALGLLRERGRAETALEVVDQAREAALLLGIDLQRVAPGLTIERARGWCAIGQTEMALREVEGLAAGSDPRLTAWVELVRAEVARLRHETAESFRHYESAAELDPSVRVEATAGRIQLLNSLGKDVETVAAVEQLQPRELEAAGQLDSRKRIYLESLAALSAYRLGQADGRSTATALIAEAEASGDVSLEAALRINLAIMERGSGSLEQARTELEAAARLYDRAGLIAGLAHARATLGGLLRELGELVDAEPLLVSAMEIRQRLSDPEGASTARGMLGLLYFERGHARSAIETLESTAENMTGAQRLRYAPLLFAKAAEMRARIGDFTQADSVNVDNDGVDPRALLARARIEWMRGIRPKAEELAGRAGALAQTLKLGRLAREALSLATRIDGGTNLPPDLGDATLSALDEEIFDVLQPDNWDEQRVQSLAEELARRGRDDRAARLWLALSARTDSTDNSRAHLLKHAEAFELCTAGLSDDETETYQRGLLGEPDPWPGDFTRRSDTLETDEDFEMEIISLLEINRQLVQQQDLHSLLGLIVEHALNVTGAERGFLVLEEHGELRFDTALDSCRGDIAQPEFEISGSVVREGLQKMQPVRVSNAVDDPLLGHQTSVVSLELRSILCVPFEITRDLRGAIYVDHRLRKGAFDDRAERLCRLLTDQAALAILQVKRMDEIRGLNRELERRVVEKEVDLQAARRALRESGTPEPGTLVGQSAAIKRVRELISRAAPSELPVLIQGESGTGKELAARSLHEQSLRSRASFVSESCAALPASLIESELFGYRKGAFTGADRNRAGLFEQAAGGTLFLDEIGELPLDLQAKFLRVLETGEVRRLGDDSAHKVDFRLIAATNRDLEDEVRAGRFRQDLFYRIAGLTVRMPLLSERTEDVEVLVEHFLRMEEASGKPRRRASKRIMAALARRNWPGNVRELRNEIARLCVLCEGDLDDTALVSRPATFGNDLSVKEIIPIAELERRAIHNALEKTGGDKRRAAELLGISRAKIYQRLKDWGEAD